MPFNKMQACFDSSTILRDELERALMRAKTADDSFQQLEDSFVSMGVLKSVNLLLAPRKTPIG